jgi:hypothetical protein
MILVASDLAVNQQDAYLGSIVVLQIGLFLWKLSEWG